MSRLSSLVAVDLRTRSGRRRVACSLACLFSRLEREHWCFCSFCSISTDYLHFLCLLARSTWLGYILLPSLRLRSDLFHSRLEKSSPSDYENLLFDLASTRLCLSTSRTTLLCRRMDLCGMSRFAICLWKPYPSLLRFCEFVRSSSSCFTTFSLEDSQTAADLFLHVTRPSSFSLWGP